MGQELLFMQQFFSQQFFSAPWAAIALLVCLFLVLILRPERIVSGGQFQAACWLLSLSIVVPTALNTLIMLVNFTSRSMPSGGSGQWVSLVSVVQGSGPVLLGLGVLFGLLALVPRWPSATAHHPTRHPLDAVHYGTIAGPQNSATAHQPTRHPLE